MIVIGLTGGVGCGKSTVLQYIQKQFGARVIQADLVARALQEKGEQVFCDIVHAFGSSILAEDGELDRSALAEIVFHDEAKLKFLNSIVHPAVKKTICRAITQAEADATPYVVIEAALLLEDHYDEICSQVWYVRAADDIRRERLKKSRGYSDEKINAMLACQQSEDEFIQSAQAVIDNSGDFEQTKKQIDALFFALERI